MVVSMVEACLDVPMLAGERQMSSHTPEDWPRPFTQHLNARDLEAVVVLYAPDARFVTRSGATVVGRDQIRDVLAGLIGAHTRWQSRVIQAVTVGEIALLYTDFQGTTVDALGTTVAIRHQAIEVLRRQPDGTWKLMVGDPNGRAGEGGEHAAATPKADGAPEEMPKRMEAICVVQKYTFRGVDSAERRSTNV
jgi:uncharacterized protein (TIGR02246 family)